MGLVKGKGWIENRVSKKASRYWYPASICSSSSREFGTQAIIGTQDILRVCLINSAKASIASIRMVKYLTVAELFGAVVLRPNELHSVGIDRFIHELALC